ncbi:PucR family transcriptional regulator [Streptomyces sp. NPDC017941]|uniref:PucR family transcriptional regulator n=1 Tax=Streptomyces sp. NPDC017941 TaxID=3365018 RepID=UPI0037B434C0
MDRTEVPLPATWHRPGPAKEAARRLQSEAGALTRQVLAALPPPEAATAHRAATVEHDLAAWFAVLSEDLSAKQVAALFRVRAATHAAAGLRCEEALLQQGLCLTTLAQAAPRTPQGPVTSPTRPHGPHLLLVACRAIVGYYDSLRGTPKNAPASPRQETRGPDRPFLSDRPVLSDRPDRPDPSGLSDTAPRWCMSAAQRRKDSVPALRAFRAANPRARIVVTGDHLIAFTRERPQRPEVFGPYGLVPVADGAPADAARQAALAAVVARYYGENIESRDTWPLLAALDIDAEKREAYMNSCLGPLYTKDRNSDLLQTLAAYLAHNMSVTAAARALYIHRQTMTHRLQAICYVTGLELDSPLDRLRAELALLLGRVARVPGPRGHVR